MKKAAMLQKAVTTLVNVKVSAAVARDLKNRKIVDVENRMQVVQMPIAKFLSWVKDVNPIRVQRNDAYRLKNNLANHLDKLMLPQGMFAAVFFEGQFYLVDGNTRKRAWLTKPNLAVPSDVFVTVMIPESREEAKLFYDCYDSKASKKTVRDEMLSLLADTGVVTESLLSKLIGGGKFVTVVQAMAKRYSVRNNLANRTKIVNDYSGQFVKLDTLGLDEGNIPMGAIWAALRLYKELSEYAEVITAYLEDLRKFDTPSACLIPEGIQHLPEKARKACELEQTGTSGAKACTAMYPVYLMGFEEYIAVHSKSKAYSKAYLKKLSAKLRIVLSTELV